MANVCSNRVFIRASKRSLDRFEKDLNLQGGDLGKALEALLPPPAGLPYDLPNESPSDFADALNGKSDRPYPTEYLWRIANYGSKTIYPKGTLSRNSDTEIELRYQTPWGPNLEYWMNLIKANTAYLHFRVEHQYHEDGLGYIGYSKTDGIAIRPVEKDLTIEHWQKAGAITINDEILWDSTYNVDLFDAFPL